MGHKSDIETLVAFLIFWRRNKHFILKQITGRKFRSAYMTEHNTVVSPEGVVFSPDIANSAMHGRAGSDYEDPKDTLLRLVMS